ncbi:hypothetical protein N7563_22865, partial [Leclercia adecarboxylata ATCC 23216 = NBRC 102595]|nr:hypothetical protein [Leclercia adecarboxylata ATCC 23216 = NBRC 102595]
LSERVVFGVGVVVLLSVFPPPVSLFRLFFGCVGGCAVGRAGGPFTPAGFIFVFGFLKPTNTKKKRKKTPPPKKKKTKKRKQKPKLPRKKK